MSSKSSFDKSPYRSIKIDTYFDAYDRVLGQYRNEDVTVVEVGILGGGSLFMWRDFFGPRARIIGIDLNPAALKWRDHGFEIFIGDQESDAFWQDFYGKVGRIDVLLDDGGHTNHQQIKTLHNALPNINDGGVVLVEDTHASYMKSFGNPSRFSFMNYCGVIGARINDRYLDRHPENAIRSHIHRYEVFQGMVAFHIDRRLCKKAVLVENAGIDDRAVDYRLGAVGSGVVGKLRGKVLRKVQQYRKRLDNILLCRRFFRSFI